MRKACVVGWPVAHSLSPVIHGYWLDVYGIQGEYTAVPVDVGHFKCFLPSLAGRGFAGANVTLPHKVTAFDLCITRDSAAQAIGAVNTVWYEDGTLCGSNTDGFGFLANLDQRAPGWDRGKRAVVFGAGGAARAIVWALTQRNVPEIIIVNRTLDRAVDLAAAFAPAQAFDFESASTAMRGADIVVNTSSLGMKGFDPLSQDFEGVALDAVVCDIVYNPLETHFLANARLKGLRCVDGLGMLLHQAVPGFEKWFGVRPVVTPKLREQVLAEMDRRTRVA